MYVLHRTTSDLTFLEPKYIHYKQVQLCDYFIASSIVDVSKNLHFEVHIIYLKILAFYFSFIF